MAVSHRYYNNFSNNHGRHFGVVGLARINIDSLGPLRTDAYWAQPSNAFNGSRAIEQKLPVAMHTSTTRLLNLYYQ